MSAIIYDRKEMTYREKKELARRALKRLEKPQPHRPLNVIDAGSFEISAKPFDWKGFLFGTIVLLLTVLLFATAIFGFNEDFIWKR